MATRAFVVGIERYANPRNNLIGVSRDVTAIIGALASFGVSDIEVVRDENARKSAIETGLSNLLKRTGPGDVAIFYFSGHGVALPPDFTGSDDPDGNDEAFVPYECDTANLILDNRMKQILDQHLSDQSFYYGFYDCCHSGDLHKNVLLSGNLFSVTKAGHEHDEVEKGIDPGQLIFNGRPPGRTGPHSAATSLGVKNLIFDESRINAVHAAASEPEKTALVLNIEGERRSVFTWAAEAALRPGVTVGEFELVVTAKQATKTRHHKPHVTCHPTQKSRTMLR
jgi:hypothetical protein